MTDDEPTYPTYLKLAELLSLQVPRSSPEHPDELLFITVHQSSELWFKLILHELGKLRTSIANGRVLEAVESVGRVNGLMRIVTAQLHALDTLSPQGFSQFRHNLGTSTGGQSAQFRAIELISGLRDPGYLEYLKSQQPLDPIVERALSQASLPELFAQLLSQRNLAARTLYATDDERELRLLAEGLLSYEQEFAMWRFLHVEVIERVIGPGTPGTGGSLGAKALRDTLGNRFFPELWAVRAEFY
ncbi:MAG TPA: tryptophan 2,3-dioxygenase family protein [Gemmatimonadaceae bacterium]|nr:tryptophan 2,3-dioxygenase family protein [Gemmatimonadaceae bacterium]